MKKVFLLIAVFSLCMGLSKETSAQDVRFTMNLGQGSTTPAVGQIIHTRVHERINSEPNAPAGTKYILLDFLEPSGKSLANGLKKFTKEEFIAGGFSTYKGFKGKITKVDNPLPIRAYDTLMYAFYYNQGLLKVEVLQSGKKSLGLMTIHFSPIQ